MANLPSLNRTDYEPFGTSAVTGLPTRASYIDKEKDSEDGTHNLGVREYRSGDGRFTSVDALWGLAPGLSPYVYSGNNPVNLSDPSGLDPEKVLDPNDPDVEVVTPSSPLSPGVYRIRSGHWGYTGILGMGFNGSDSPTLGFFGGGGGLGGALVMGGKGAIGGNKAGPPAPNIRASNPVQGLFQALEESESSTAGQLLWMLHDPMGMIRLPFQLFDDCRVITTSVEGVAQHMSGSPAGTWDVVRAGINIVGMVVAVKAGSSGFGIGVRKPIAVARQSENVNKAVDEISKWLGEGAEIRQGGGSDLILKSKGGLRQIRFDLINSHGELPHINIEEWGPRNWYPSDRRMIELNNIHIFYCK